MPEDAEAYVNNALMDLASLRSDIVSELGNNTSDLFLKTSFTAAIDSAEENLRRALL